MHRFEPSQHVVALYGIQATLHSIFYVDGATETARHLKLNPLCNSTGTALVGTFVGMLFFGWYGDYVGRKRAYLPALVLMLIGTLGCTFSSPLATGKIQFHIWIHM